MFDDATIVAIATANGIGSISIVRISGANALAIASKISKKTTFQPRLATLSYLYDTNNEIIDEALDEVKEDGVIIGRYINHHKYGKAVRNTINALNPENSMETHGTP